MTLDEAIKHAEEVVEANQRVVDTGIVFDDVTIDMLYCDDTEIIDEHLANYQWCADEHRQLAEWLKDYKRLLEQQPSDDCVSREQAKIDVISNSLYTSEQVIALLDNLPSVTPTQCIATVRFSKEDLREICNERIEIACEHGTCKDCRHREGINFDDWFCAKHGNSARDDFYCADFEKRGDKNGN